MSSGKISGRYRPQVVTQAHESERKVGFWLWLGILGLPIPFAFYTLAKGYSLRARVISLGYTALLIIPALIFGDKGHTTQPQAQTQASASVESASASIDLNDPELVASSARLKRSTALVAYTLLTTARPLPADSIEQYNARVTLLYNNWVAAEENAEGPNWQQAYLNSERQDRDCSDLYGHFMHEDDQLRQARAACAAASYAPAPTVPTLDDFLMKPEVAPAQTNDAQATADDSQSAPDDAQAVSEDTDYVATISQGQ